MLQLDFNPERVTYEALLAEFFSAHRPTRPAYKRQYRSVILCSEDAQRDVAARTLAAEQARAGTLHTAIEPLRSFTRAEDYHQKYYLRDHDALMRLFPRDCSDGFTDSTVAMRLNAIAGGHGSPQLVAALELPDDARRLALGLIASSNARCSI